MNRYHKEKQNLAHPISGYKWITQQQRKAGCSHWLKYTANRLEQSSIKFILIPQSIHPLENNGNEEFIHWGEIRIKSMWQFIFHKRFYWICTILVSSSPFLSGHYSRLHNLVPVLFPIFKLP